ncbi:MAG: DMT family transporter [Marinovum sp.]|nr:DMT family transporter [Marinovum sp.]
MSQIHAIFLRISAASLLVVMSARVYEALKQATLGQAIFWRSLWSLPVIVLYARVLGPFRYSLQTNQPFGHVLRGVMGLVAMALNFLCLAHLNISYATSLGFLAPILVLPLAAVFLAEKITKMVLFASFLGFSGVLMISFAELDTGDMPIASFIGIAAGLGFALTMAFTRVFVKQLSAKDSAALIALSFSVITMLGGLATLPFGWGALGDEAHRYLMFAGLLGGLGHVLSNEAVKRSDISVLGPFDYTAIIWALAIDVMVFGFVPNRLGLFGIFVIAFAALSLAVKQVRSA